LLELEGRTEVMLKLRNAMVSGDTGSMLDVRTPLIVDSHHVVPVLMNYYYGPIGNTTFRSVIENISHFAVYFMYFIVFCFVCSVIYLLQQLRFKLTSFK
jgi:hypothetical protein